MLTLNKNDDRRGCCANALMTTHDVIIHVSANRWSLVPMSQAVTVYDDASMRGLIGKSAPYLFLTFLFMLAMI